MDIRLRSPWIRIARLLCVAAVLAAPARATAQPYQTLGKAKCVNCHDHEAEKLWSEKKDGPPPNNHLNALSQLEAPKSAVFAKAIGLADPYDPRGACAACHGTMLKGNLVDGVTCETCHGPGSGYVDVHQQKGAYRQAVGAGLADTVKNPDMWAPMCVRCHTVSDSALIQAGHPSGDDFDLGAKFATVASHWKSVYPNKADITARARSSRATIVASRKPPIAPPAAAVAAATSPAIAFAPAPAAPPAAVAARVGPAAAAPAVRFVVPGPAAASAPAIAPVPAPPPTFLLPLTPSAAVAAVQGRVLSMLDSLLRRDARGPIHVPAPPASSYNGPDAELLRLQDEVLSLAIESLSAPPQARKP